MLPGQPLGQPQRVIAIEINGSTPGHLQTVVIMSLWIGSQHEQKAKIV